MEWRCVRLEGLDVYAGTEDSRARGEGIWREGFSGR